MAILHKILIRSSSLKKQQQRSKQNIANLKHHLIHQTSPSTLAVTNFDLVRLQRFLQDTIPTNNCTSSVTNSSLKLSAIEQAERINDIINTSTDNTRLSSYRDTLYDCITILQSFITSLSSSKRNDKVPSNSLIIYETHTLIGSIQDHLKQYKVAIQSYLKALWIATNVTTDDNFPSDLLVGLTLHRLGKVYGEIGSYKDAKTLLVKAIEKYNEEEQILLHYNKDLHLVIKEGQDLLILYRNKRLSSLFKNNYDMMKSWKSCSIKIERPLGTLSIIQEENERRMSVNF